MYLISFLTYIFVTFWESSSLASIELVNTVNSASEVLLNSDKLDLTTTSCFATDKKSQLLNDLRLAAKKVQVYSKSGEVQKCRNVTIFKDEFDQRKVLGIVAHIVKSPTNVNIYKYTSTAVEYPCDKNKDDPYCRAFFRAVFNIKLNIHTGKDSRENINNAVAASSESLRVDSDIILLNQIKQELHMIKSGKNKPSTQLAGQLKVNNYDLNSARKTKSINSGFSKIGIDYFKKGAKLLGHTCEDGSFSATSESADFGGWEGHCGQTAAANMLYALCRKLPSSVRRTGKASGENNFFNDLTPGVHPDTMARDFNGYLKSVNCKGREVTNGKIHNPFISNGHTASEAIKKQAVLIESLMLSSKSLPVMFLTGYPEVKDLHWVTAMRIEKINGKKMMVLNDGGDQIRVNIEDFAKLSLIPKLSSVGFQFSDLNYVSVK